MIVTRRVFFAALFGESGGRKYYLDNGSASAPRIRDEFFQCFGVYVKQKYIDFIYIGKLVGARRD